MGFTIPNAADAFNANQAEVDKVDLDILVAGYARTGVASGCAVTAQGSPDMTCAVAAGVVEVAGVPATVASGNVTITAADGANPRIDLVVANNSGTKSVTAGTAAAEPVMPAIPANSVVLAAVYVPTSDTTIATNQITDKRVLLEGVHKPIQHDYVGCRAYLNAATQTLTTNTNTAVTLDAESYDSTTFHDNVTNNTRMTIPTGYGGLYQMTANVTFAASGTGVRQCFFRINGTTVVGGNALVEPIDEASNSTVVFLCGLHELVAGDYVELIARHTHGSDLAIEGGSIYATNLAVTMVGV